MKFGALWVWNNFLGDPDGWKVNSKRPGQNHHSSLPKNNTLLEGRCSLQYPSIGRDCPQLSNEDAPRNTAKPIHRTSRMFHVAIVNPSRISAAWVMEDP